MRFSRQILTITACLAIFIARVSLGDENLCEAPPENEAETAYTQIRDEAKVLAGEPQDIPQRVIFLHEIYLDSGSLFEFPEVALHGALWAFNFFKVENFADSLLTREPSWADKELGSIADTANDLSFALKGTNREVFIDTYTNYYYSKSYGDQPEALRHISGDLLAKLSHMHEEAKLGHSMSASERRDLFLSALSWEQDETVSARVKAAVSRIASPELRKAMLRPIVRFEYFPLRRAFLFHDFSDKAERIKRATEAYDIASRVGWPKIASSMRKYQVLPDAFFVDPHAYAEQLKRCLLQNDVCPDQWR